MVERASYTDFIEQMGKTESKGFTLLEILIALFIFAIVLTTVFASYTGTLSLVDETESRAEMYDMARTALERIREDLESAYLPETLKEQKEAFKEEGFVGADQEINGKSADTLRFCSRAHIDFTLEGRGLENARISYYLKESENGGSFSLYRSDTPIFERASNENEAGVVLCDDLTSINFIYYDAYGEAHSSWDSKEGNFKNKLPSRVSVIIELSYHEAKEEPLKFMTGVSLPMGEHLHGKMR